MKLGEHLFKAFAAENLKLATELMEKLADDGDYGKMLNWKNAFQNLYSLVHLVGKNGNIELLDIL